MFGSGAGCVVLRRLKDALADGDHIWAVVKGTAINNDGAAKAQLMTIFEALKPTDPIVLKGRRKLSSMIFA